jgi:hypothetical protein
VNVVTVLFPMIAIVIIAVADQACWRLRETLARRAQIRNGRTFTRKYLLSPWLDHRGH